MNVETALRSLVEWRDHATGAQDAETQFFEFCLRNLAKTKSQLLQELFVLFELSELRNGYFVEFGAADGIRFSNTHMLEFEYGWRGILAEPAKVHQQRLRESRNCNIDDRCVWTKSGELLSFLEAEAPALSTIQTFRFADYHGARRGTGRTYEVQTVSLVDLLNQHGAPRKIDYMSIDTEGSELEILRSFDF